MSIAPTLRGASRRAAHAAIAASRSAETRAPHQIPVLSVWRGFNQRNNEVADGGLASRTLRSMSSLSLPRAAEAAPIDPPVPAKPPPPPKKPPTSAAPPPPPSPTVKAKTLTEQFVEALEGTDGLTPSKTVELLDRFIVGQSDAKRACAVALRNRWRRHRVDPSLRDEIVPKNILMIGESHLHFISVRAT